LAVVLALESAASDWFDVRVIWFDDAHVRRRAGDTWYARGLDYLDQVDELRWSPGEVVATVHGTSAYLVRLSNRGGQLHGDCSCPWGQEGNFCKHCAAVGLAALADAPAEPATSTPEPATSTPEPHPVDLRTYLNGVDPATLVELLVELAEHDPALHRRLSLRAGTGGPDAAELDLLVDGLRTYGPLDSAELAGLGRAADEALHALDTLVTDHPATIGPLYQRALWHLARTDLEDHYGDAVKPIRNAAARAITGFAAACRLAPTDQDELARWLLDLQLHAVGFRDIAVTDFTEALGDGGLASYWQHLCQLNVDRPSVADEEEDEDDEEETGESRGRTILRLREQYLTDITKDVDGLVALYAEDLSDPYQYVRIGETLRAAGRIDDAITWLHRGLSSATWSRGSMTDLLVQLYVQTGRHKEAARIRWDDFARNPGEYNYRMLLRAAEPLDASAYAKDRAIRHLRERAVRGGYHAGDPLVTILVAARDIDQAWTAAHEFECSDECLFLLARNSATSHPAEAIPIYAREVGAAIGRKDGRGYASATKLLLALKDLHQRAGSDFTTYLTEVKTTHRRKSTLMAGLAAAGL
jgi:tetratricopeptide (TPR) repeat protein